MMRHHLAGTLLLLAAAPAGAQMFPGDPDAGRAFALRLCADCHVVTNQPAGRAADGAPTFPSIARSAAATELGLRVFLQTPHLRMPDFVLTRREIDDVISYILSLRGQ